MMWSRFKFIHKSVALTLSCLLWVLSSCSNYADAPDVSPGGEKVLSLSFKIPTRAVTDGYEEGETYENYIDIVGSNLRIYFFDTDNKFIAGVDPSDFITVVSNDYSRYDVLGKVPDALVKHNTFKMVVLANWPKYPGDDANTTLEVGVTTIADICNAPWAQYNCLTDGNETNPASVALDPDAGRLMPFYGVHEYSNITFKPGEATILSEPVTLLRAMAKVEVILETDEYYDLSFSSLKINRYNARGYCAPKNVFKQDDYDHKGIWEKDYTRFLHLENDRNDDDEKELSFRFVRRWDNNDGKRYEKWMAYVPEYQNIGVGENYSSIKARFDNVQTEPFTIFFANYHEGQSDNSNDQRLNIERNNIYRFTVTVRDSRLAVNVQDWRDAYDNNYIFD